MSRRKIDQNDGSRKATPSGMSIVKRVRLDEAPVSKIVSETDERIQRLYETQAAVEGSLDGVRERFKVFTQPTVYKPTASQVKGQRSLHSYTRHEDEKGRSQQLRDSGLTEDEIDLWMNQAPSSKMNPEVLQQRLTEIADRLKKHDEEVNVDKGFSTAQSTSRHKLELERALNQGREQQATLSSLLMKPTDVPQLASNNPDSQLKQIALELGEKRTPIPDYGNPFPNPWTPVAPKLAPSTEFVGPRLKDADLSVSDEQLMGNKLSVKEIRQLPKFTNYEPGKPSSVLYVKNLGSTVKHDHLIHLFGRFRVPGDDVITCQLMTGRMRGQAFVTCADIETASRCLHTLCGYILRGRPMIISYRQPKRTDSTQQTGTTPSD